MDTIEYKIVDIQNLAWDIATWMKDELEVTGDRHVISDSVEHVLKTSKSCIPIKGNKK